MRAGSMEYSEVLAESCVYGEWSAWSPCSASGCEQGGFESRTRVIVQEGSGYGERCQQEQLEEWRQCQGPPCQEDCVMSNWSQWSACSADCDEGSRSRTRFNIKPAKNGGRQCGPAEEWEACNNGPCAQDCVMSEWSAWSQCSADCGEGRRARTRSILTPAKNGGISCGPAEEWEACNDRPCAQDCVMAEWSQWSQCSADCGEGRRARTRFTIAPAKNGGIACGPAEEWEACNDRPCQQDCVMGSWSSWSQCSADCDEGRRARTRSTLTPAAFGGIACGPAEEWEACNNGPCKIDCVMSQWSAWTQCSNDCGKGRRSRSRFVQVQPLNGGQACSPAEEWTVCNNGPCPQDCGYGAWSAWSQCPVCGQASRSRSRPITQNSAFGGSACDFASLAETEACNNSPCPVDCQMTQWSAWSRCSADCDEGRRSRHRQTIVAAAFGGLQCGPAEEWEACNNGPCAQDCVMSEWGAWSQCSADCGEGRRARTRFTLAPAKNGGVSCGPSEEWEACSERPCAQDCVMAEWSQWSQCSADCGEGRRARTRSVVTPALNGGLSCGPAEEWEACSAGPCSKPCQVSQWSSWSSCSAECGEGQQSRRRFITAPAVGNGAACPTLEDLQRCQSAPCREPSVCDNVFSTQFFADGCNAEFILCAKGQEHRKICPEPSRFDIVSKTCKLPKDVPACRNSPPANPPTSFNYGNRHQ